MSDTMGSSNFCSYPLAFLIAVLSTVTVAAQSPSVGDEVRYQCFCFGQEWVKATVLSVGGGNVRVRFGNLDSQVVTLPINSPKLRMSGTTSEFRADPIQQAFSAEAGRFQKSVAVFAHFYDPQFNYGGGYVRAEEWRQAMTELAELDSLCKTRFRGVKNFEGPTYIKLGSIDYRFATWCEVAARRTQIEPIARAGIAKTLINLGYTEENLNFGFNEPDNPVRWETQELIWQREKWRAAKLAWLKPKYAEYGVAVPADATAAAEKRADQLKELVLAGAPNRSYKQPPYRDAAAEAVVKAAFLKEYPGVQVVKIGLDYRTWVQRKSLDYIASDDIFRYYKVSYNSYKRGTALLKIPGRPFCQMHDWVVGLSGKSIVPAGVGGSGTFMRCE